MGELLQVCHKYKLILTFEEACLIFSLYLSLLEVLMEKFIQTCPTYTIKLIS